MHLKDAVILIVDDEEMLREILGEVFEPVAKQVYLAENGQQALEVIASHPIDLIISDIRMPVLDGVGLLQELRAQNASRPSLIFITGYSVFSPRELFDLGAEALLNKPIDFTRLLETAQHSVAERSEPWRTPLPESAVQATMTQTFTSLEDALETHQIAFGRGGFCLRTEHSIPQQTVHIELSFVEDHYALSGQGQVLWTEVQEQLAGVELIYVADDSRPRIVALTEGSTCYIPRST